MPLFNKKYRLTLEDESSLEKKVNLSLSFFAIILLGVAFLVVAGALGIFVFASSPMKNRLPGYLKESERTATEEQHLRLDSLVQVYEINEAYISGILNALNPSEETPWRAMDHKPHPLTLDSLKPASPEERRFMERIRERDKYDIDYSSPSPSQTLMFGNVYKGAVISQDSRESQVADIILPKGAPVAAVAEGKVISVATSPKNSGAFEVIIQHPKGFLSKTGRLSRLLVRPGDIVAAGQIIATGAAREGLKGNHVSLQLWHDGDPLIPSRFLPPYHSSPKSQNNSL
ncbi:MAG: M23 family metallopeptidase [Muribaculaceae bacterium]|nr:M23 family metallopeptidase [Muribaculaceae bacterium]